MAQPLYNIDDVVYLRASAKIGHLEAYKISSIHQISPNKWVYKIDIAKRMPQPQTAIDRYDLRSHTVGLHFEESALMTYCDALAVVISNLERRLTAMRAKWTDQCEEG